MTEASLAGRRILVVEDEPLVSMLVEDILLDLGCEEILTATRLSEALVKAEEMSIDAALLDINLNGEQIYPVAERLQKRGIPFVFSTGYGASEIIPEFQQYPILQKPFQPDALQAALSQLFAPKMAD